MDNETTTMPAMLTQPGSLPATAESEPEPLNPVYLLIFLASLLTVAALVYFI